MSGNRGRRGESLVDLLLVVTAVVIGMIVAAYVWMPDFQRGVHTVARDVERRFAE